MAGSRFVRNVTPPYSRFSLRFQLVTGGRAGVVVRRVFTPNPERKPPKVISPSDPCSAWTAKANKRVQFGYGLSYLIDIENAVMVDVEPTPARTYDEVESDYAGSY